MGYLDQSEIASNTSMIERMIQCAVTEGIDDAEAWVTERRREWAAAPGWDAAWASAQAAHEDDLPEDPPYDPGADESVITDAQILSQVQSMNTK